MAAMGRAVALCLATALTGAGFQGVHAAGMHAEGGAGAALAGAASSQRALLDR